MGLNKQTLKLLLSENQYKSISGEYLSIGRHTVNIDRIDLKASFREYNLSETKLDHLYEIEKFDNITRHSNNTILDADLLKCFSEAHYNCLDRSDYEGANILHDLNTQIPSNLTEKFDFIYNGSCMDNIFDPFTFIKNSSDLLKPNGRILHIECAGGVPGAYLMYSPEWFFSYYAINNFKDCKVYVTIAKEEGKALHMFDVELYHWQPFYTRGTAYSIIDACKSIKGLMHVIVIAEKGPESTSHLTPIQMQYLDEEAVDWRQKYYEFGKSNRSLICQPTGKENIELPFLTDHYVHLNDKF